jgi:hypothetical protein
MDRVVLAPDLGAALDLDVVIDDRSKTNRGTPQRDVRQQGESAMRLVRFGGAMSLDGYIAGPNGEYDWILMDPDIDFDAIARQFDTFLIGRKTFEAMVRMGSGAASMPGARNIVFAHAESGRSPTCHHRVRRRVGGPQAARRARQRHRALRRR